MLTVSLTTVEMEKNNMVAFNAVIRESIMKEQRAFRLREYFSLNPKVSTLPLSHRTFCVEETSCSVSCCEFAGDEHVAAEAEFSCERRNA